MNFDLHLYGETPAELLEVLSHLGHADSNYHTPIPDERHPAQVPAPQTQSEPAARPDKPKAPAPAKQKQAAEKPAATPAEEPENPTTPTAPTPNHSSAPDAGAAGLTASNSVPEKAGGQNAPTGSSTPEPDPATLDKIRDLARSLIVHGKRTEVQQIIKSTGTVSISKLPPDSYTGVWQQLVDLSKEVDGNAAG